MTKAKGAVPALRLTLGGAPNVFHTLGEYPGLWHPTIAVPVDVVDGDETWAQARHDEAGCPVELVYLTEAEAAAGREAFAKASGETYDALLARLGGGIPMAAPDSSVDGDGGAHLAGVEAERVAAAHKSLTTTVETKE